MTRRSRSPNPQALAAIGCCRTRMLYVGPMGAVRGWGGSLKSPDTGIGLELWFGIDAPDIDGSEVGGGAGREWALASF